VGEREDGSTIAIANCDVNNQSPLFIIAAFAIIRRMDYLDTLRCFVTVFRP
jgi:hypothetical protein